MLGIDTKSCQSNKATAPPFAGSVGSINPAIGREKRWVDALKKCAPDLQPPDAAGKQQQAEADDPRPCRYRFANPGHSELCSQRNEKHDETNDPHRHRWSFT